MLLPPRGLLGGLVSDSGPVIGGLVGDLGNILDPKPKHSPTQTHPTKSPTNSPKPVQSPNPSPSSKSGGGSSSNPGNGNGNGNGDGNGDGTGTTSVPSTGDGNSSPSQSAGSGNPAQSPTNVQSTPSQQPSSIPQGSSQQSPDPVANAGSSPSGSSVPQLVSDPTNNAQPDANQNSLQLSSVFTSGGTVYALSGSQTVTVPSNFGFTQPATSTDASNSNTGPVSGSAQHKGIPSVAIGLTVTAVVLIGLFGAVFVMRRVHQRRRADRRTRWAPVMSESVSADAGASRSSVRSSFATTFDYGLRIQSPVPVSEMPTVPPLSHIPEIKRLSMESDHSQWLMVDRPAVVDDTGRNGSVSPLSVAPFTPSESYKFPQPPQPSGSEPDDASPFSDYAVGTSYLNSSKKTDEKQAVQVGGPAIVSRPFAPSLPDELYVSPGQVVTVEQMFDDGWNLVKAEDGSRGLVPLACFENDEQPNSKRRSSLIDFAN